ncbi:hypothetical protein DKX38_027174 [Salix brachista]|uniref:ADP-ribosyl cyclase/cyclic ADP-ribose hydrolase n=1 Tax=Salix brachista TaxID=2182728 RepID=A0A5N5JD47_9ROSI|nr:hypothetical protein DKX38_027174 [Salix brachista]
MLALEDCRMLESLPEVPSKVQTVNLNGCIRLKEIPDPIKVCLIQDLDLVLLFLEMKFQASLTINRRDLQLAWKCIVGAWEEFSSSEDLSWSYSGYCRSSLFDKTSIVMGAVSMPDIQRMWDDIPVIRGVDTSNAFTHLSTASALRGIIPDDKELEKVMVIRSRLLEAIEESGVSVILFARDCASLTWCFDELVKMVRFMDEMRPNTVFPVSYDGKQSIIYDQTRRRYTIVFDKNEENCRDDVKVKRWMNILTRVEDDEKSRRESLKR